MLDAERVLCRRSQLIGAANVTIPVGVLHSYPAGDRCLKCKRITFARREFVD